MSVREADLKTYYCLDKRRFIVIIICIVLLNIQGVSAIEPQVMMVQQPSAITKESAITHDSPLINPNIEEHMKDELLRELANQTQTEPLKILSFSMAFLYGANEPIYPGETSTPLVVTVWDSDYALFRGGVEITLATNGGTVSPSKGNSEGMVSFASNTQLLPPQAYILWR